MLNIALNATLNKVEIRASTEPAYRWPDVALEGEDFTRDKKSRVLTSLVKEGIARNASKIPAGGVGPS